MQAFDFLCQTLRDIDSATYDWQGDPLPYLDGLTSISTSTPYPSATFGWSMNGRFQGTTQSDATGTVSLEVHLEPGLYTFNFEHDFSGRTFTRTVRVLLIATVYSAWADIFDALSTEIDAYADAKVLDRARLDYLEAVHGVRIGLANTLGLSEEAYRNALRTLSSGYRHAQGLRDTIERVLAVLVGADGFIVPIEWRRFWTRNRNLAVNADQTERTLLVTGDPNTYVRQQFVIEAWAAGAALTYTLPLVNQPPEPSAVNVVFPTGWNAANAVTFVGLDVNGAVVREVFAVPGSLPGTVAGAQVFASFSEVSKVNALGSGNLSAGLQTGNFLRIGLAFPNTPLGTGGLGLNLPVNGVAGSFAIWRGGSTVGLDDAVRRSREARAPVDVVVAGPRLAPYIVGQRVVAAGGSVTLADTGASANVRGRIVVDGVESEIRYPAGSTLASALLAGFDAQNPALTAGTLVDFDATTAFALGYAPPGAAAFRVEPTACDFAFGTSSVLQLPVASATTTAGIATGATSVMATGLSAFQSYTGAVPWDGDSAFIPTSDTAARGLLVRVGRGRRIAQTLTVTTVLVAGTNMADVTFTPSGVGAAFDGDTALGAYLGLSGYTAGNTANNGLHQIVAATSNGLGVYTVRVRHVNARTGGAFVAAAGVTSILVELYSMGELARLTAIDIGTNTATLARGNGGLVGTYASGVLIERERDLHIDQRALAGREYDALQLWVDARYRPRNASATGETNTLTVVGTEMPDAWRVFDNTDVGAGTVIDVTPVRVPARQRTVIATNAAGNILPGVGGFIPEERVAPWRDQVVRIDTWVTAHNGTSGSSYAAIEVSFDGGDNWTLGSNNGGVAVPNRFYAAATRRGAMSNATAVTSRFEVPALATNASRTTIEGRGLWWRVRFSTAAFTSPANPPAGSYFSVGRVLVSPLFAGASGDFVPLEHVPVAAARRVYGNLIYAWPGEDVRAANTSLGSVALTEGERALLRGQVQSQVESSSHAAGTQEVIYVGEYRANGSTGNQELVNRLGAHDPITFASATRESIEAIDEAPFGWLSWARPTGVPAAFSSAVFSGSPPRANLTVAAAKSGSFPQAPSADDLLAIYPVNQTPLIAETIASNLWTWNSATQVELDATTYAALTARYGLGATFGVTYRRPVRLTTAALDLGANFSEYSWLIDASIWVKPNPGVRVTRVRETLSFADGLRAPLAWRPKADALATAVLTVSSPTTVTTLAPGAFSVGLDDDVNGAPGATVTLTGTGFDSGNAYDLEYDALVLSPRSSATYVLEARTASSEANLAAATWYPVNRHEILDIGRTVGVTVAARRWAQVRVNFTSIDAEAANDVRIYSVGLKGVRLRGANRFAPGVLV